MEDEFEEEIEVDEKIKKDPYNEILKFAENRLKHVGHKIFSYVSLMPISLVSPSIIYEDTTIRSNIHVMLLANSGAGKSMTAGMLNQIAYNPIDFDMVTSAGMEETLFGMSHVTLIVQDMARIIQDQFMVKTLEGLSGEEKRAGSITVSRGDKRFNIDTSVFLAGVPSDITAYISGGLIFRFSPLLIMHDSETHKKIGKEIALSIGKKVYGTNIEGIKNFYKLIYQIQLGKNKNIPKIDGYVYKEDYNLKINDKWEKTLNKIDPESERNPSKPQTFNWFREELSGARYMYNSAMLNMFNRKIEIEKGKNLIVPEESDLRLGMFLMANEMRLKAYLLNCNKIASRIKDIKYLEKYRDRDNINNLTFEIIKVILEGKK